GGFSGYAASTSLAKPDQFLASEEFLKSQIVSNWVPDRIDLQALDGSVKTGRDGEQPLQRFDGVGRLTSACLYFGIGGKTKTTGQSIFFQRHQLSCLSRKSKSF